jgi:hypothetical protein
VSGAFVPGDAGLIIVNNVKDLNGNAIVGDNVATLAIPNGITPHTIFIDGVNDFISPSERVGSQVHNLYITWDDTNLYVGFFSLNLNGGGDLFVNIDTDQLPGSGATTDSWGRVDFSGQFLPEYQVAIEGGGGSMQVNNWTGTAWNYPGNGTIGNSYEGWASNGLTEIAVPWSALGNPEGFAISVHYSQEDSHTIPEVFPQLNPTGNHPVITYLYAFFEPYISGPMPLAGMEPVQVKAVPNTPPQIIAYSPLNLNQVIQPGNSQLFSATATDAENDPLTYTWKLDGTQVGTFTSYLYEPNESSVGNHVLQVIVGDEVPGNIPASITWNIEVTDVPLRLSLKVFLEGPFETSEMSVTLNQEILLPLNQPYNTAPWNYSGTEQVISIPGVDIVDWILVELRDAPDAAAANASTVISTKAAFVKKDGTVSGIDGLSVLSFDVNLNQQLFVVIRHRDHLSIMSAFSLVEAGGIYSYDFSTGASQVFGGQSGYKEIGSGIWGMVGGDANADGIIDQSDLNDYWKTEAGLKNYFYSDFNLDSEVDNQDKNDKWYPNFGTGFQSQVPQ